MNVLLFLLVVSSTAAVIKFPLRSDDKKYPDDSGKYVYDDGGKYHHDNKGEYEPDYSGQYHHDNSGQYIPDDSGKYYPDDSGTYIPDDSGIYYPDYSGKYTPDESGKYSHDSSGDYRNAKKANKFRKTRSILPIQATLSNIRKRNGVSKPSNTYLPSLDKRVADEDAARINSTHFTNNTNSNKSIPRETGFLPRASERKVSTIKEASKLNGKLEKTLSTPLSSNNFRQRNATFKPFLSASVSPNKNNSIKNILARFPKIPQILKPILRTSNGFGFSIIYNKINKSHIVFNYGPNQNISQKISAPVRPRRPNYF